MIKKSILFFACFLFLQCNSKQNKNWLESMSFEDLKVESSNYIQKYYDSNNPAMLDSALLITDYALKKDTSQIVLYIGRKLGILSSKQDYAKAIEFIDSIDDLFDDSDPYFPSVRYRFLAMDAQKAGKIEKRNEYFMSGIRFTQNFLDENREEVTKYLDETHPPVQLLKGPFAVALVQNNFYYAQVFGNDKARARIDSIRKHHPNAAFLCEFIEDYLEEDPMIFIGF